MSNEEKTCPGEDATCPKEPTFFEKLSTTQHKSLSALTEINSIVGRISSKVCGTDSEKEEGKELGNKGSCLAESALNSERENLCKLGNLLEQLSYIDNKL